MAGRSQSGLVRSTLTILRIGKLRRTTTCHGKEFTEMRNVNWALHSILQGGDA